MFNKALFPVLAFAMSVGAASAQGVPGQRAVPERPDTVQTVADLGAQSDRVAVSMNANTDMMVVEPVIVPKVEKGHDH